MDKKPQIKIIFILPLITNSHTTFPHLIYFENVILLKQFYLFRLFSSFWELDFHAPPFWYTHRTCYNSKKNIISYIRITDTVVCMYKFVQYSN